MRMFAPLTAIIATMAFAAGAAAQTAGDPRVAALLKTAGLETCKTDNDGDYICGVQISDKRSQAVWVVSKPMKIGGVETRKVFTIGYMSNGPLSAAEASALLEENARFNFGGWEIQQSDGKTAAMFASHVNVNATAAQLLEAFSLVAVAADQKEEEKTGKDDF